MCIYIQYSDSHYNSTMISTVNPHQLLEVSTETTPVMGSP